MNRQGQDTSGIRVAVSYSYSKERQTYRFARTISLNGVQQGHTVVTEILRTELDAMKMLTGIHHKRAKQFAQLLCNEVETTMKAQTRAAMSRMLSQDPQPDPWANNEKAWATMEPKLMGQP